MSIERYVESIPQTADAVPTALPLERGPGNFFLFVASLVNVTITLMYDGHREVFSGVNGGLYIRRIKPWHNMRIDGAIATQVTFFYGTEKNDKDETDIRQGIAILSGVSAVAINPAQNVITAGPTVQATGGAAVVPQNLLRRRITIATPTTNTGPLYAQQHGNAAAGQGIPLQPGVYVEFDNTASIDLRNDTGANQSYSTFEET